MMKVSRLDVIAEKQAERAALKDVVNDTKDIEEIRAKYAVKDWSGFDKIDNVYWRHIADLYPGVQVYACGSRVRGDYIDPGSPEYWRVKDARLHAGMANKAISDYDYWIPQNTPTAKSHALNIDRVRVRIPDNEKIPIPMWDFSKLPESEHANVKALLSANDIQSLVKIHDRYGLSPHSYCCSGIEGVRNWFEWAIKEGIIK
jgi:hypothetical protein